MSQREVRWNPRDKTRYLGKNIPRVDGPAKVAGTAKYTYDISLPGMAYGKILRSPYPNARVKTIDISKAKRIPGVLVILDDLGRQARFAGHEIAAVAAETEEIAEDAIRAIEIEWETFPHVVNTRIGMDNPDRVGEPQEISRGEDPSTLWGKAAATVEGEYYVPVREHLCLETHGVVAHWESDDKLTLYVSTQAVHGIAQEIAAATGIPSENVKVICEYMGGGFGSKFSAGIEGITAVRLAKAAGRPVKLMLDRYEEQVASGNGPDALMRCKAAIDSDGKLLAMEADLWGTGGSNRSWRAPLPYIYSVPNVRIRMRGVSTNTGSARALRAPMHPQASFLMETVLDELACKLGLDPLEVRIKNQNSEVRARQLRLGAERIGWNRRNQKPGASTGRYQRGIGCASSTWGGGGGEGSICEVRIRNDGSVWVGIGTQDLGTGTRTYVAAIVAEDLGLPIEKIKSEIGRSELPPSGGSGGSTTAASVSPAVKMAVLAARAKLFQTVSEILNVPPEDLECVDGQIRSKSDPSKSISFEKACARLPMGGIVEHGEFNPALQQGGVAGAQFVEVEVDTWTGHVRPVKVVAIQDCGYFLNKLAAESQIIGGVIQGLSMALFEDRKMDDQTGRMLNPNMEAYKVVGSLEVPEIEPILFETHDRVAGIGEPVVIPTAAALGNAVYNATGVRIRTLPITPKRWFDTLGGKS
ncbi:MAG TPA: xanthine dehydrogenase family protein molybdopterin-binding subunit [Fimbriimonadales bacterium]|nr:xanthine dehydrogenase family protein molybdopterin-binding subunit [Fimbriimonadales bacterium]